MEKKNKKLKVIYKQVNRNPKIITIDNTLEAKQKLVGGYIEVVSYKDDMLLICNEEGKINNLKANVIFDNDYIAGDFLIVSDDFDNADFKSLTESQIKTAIKDILSRSIKYKNNSQEREF